MKVDDKGEPVLHYGSKSYVAMVLGLKRKEEVKKEFQDYLNNSCDKYKENKDERENITGHTENV